MFVDRYIEGIKQITSDKKFLQQYKKNGMFLDMSTDEVLYDLFVKHFTDIKGLVLKVKSIFLGDYFQEFFQENILHLIAIR